MLRERPWPCRSVFARSLELLSVSSVKVKDLEEEHVLASSVRTFSMMYTQRGRVVATQDVQELRYLSALHMIEKAQIDAAELLEHIFVDRPDSRPFTSKTANDHFLVVYCAVIVGYGLVMDYIRVGCRSIRLE